MSAAAAQRGSTVTHWLGEAARLAEQVSVQADGRLAIVSSTNVAEDGQWVFIWYWGKPIGARPRPGKHGLQDRSRAAVGGWRLMASDDGYRRAPAHGRA